MAHRGRTAAPCHSRTKEKSMCAPRNTCCSSATSSYDGDTLHRHLRFITISPRHLKSARTAHAAGEMCLPTRNNEKQLCVRTPLCVSPRAAPFLLSMINCVGGNSKLLRRTQSSFITHEHTLEV